MIRWYRYCVRLKGLESGWTGPAMTFMRFRYLRDAEAWCRASNIEHWHPADPPLTWWEPCEMPKRR